MDVFAWQPSDMAGVPRRLIKHALNVNNFVPTVAKKRRVHGTEKSKVVTREVKEWVKAGIVRPVKYPTWISNSVLVKKRSRDILLLCEDAFWPEECWSHIPADMIMDVAKTFDNLRKINMKLNLMKCSFGIEEGKFLGYMVTLEGIRANPKKTKATTGMQSPKTLKEMQSLNGKWTEEAEHVFQELKKLILELPMLTTPERKEALFIYLAASREAVSGVLILNKPKFSGKLAKYAVELGAYNITYISRTAVKGQVLSDFINEVLVGAKKLEICSLAGEGDPKGWTLYTDGASSQKGVGAGLVLIDPSGTEYTYAIRLTFPSTNNKAEYEALLAGLRIAWKIKVQALDVKVDSKLVACQMNGEIVANAQEVSTIVEEEEDNWMTPIISCLEEELAEMTKTSRALPNEKSVASKLHNKGSAYNRASGTCTSEASPLVACGRQGTPPKRSRKTQFIIMAIDYFTNWIEVKPLAKTTRMGYSRLVDDIPNILWTHRTMLKTSNGETPFSLTYGSEAVIPAEIGMPTYRTIHFNEAQNEEEMRLNLDLSQERKETTAIREAKSKEGGVILQKKSPSHVIESR
ncbi:reverse transcriptase domain-containing protein [Tanacetum coccineum]|uniref:Reverse transcriptase domain-containing protein n=1 Tax=Tanacetum coccineum TaxID=301880 RepID=A0ABQ4ZZ90_9ASTR